MYLHCFQINKANHSRIFIGPFHDEAAADADAFRERIEKTRAASPLLSSGYAIEIAPGIIDGWGAVTPKDFQGFSVQNPETGEAITIPLAE